MPVIKREITHPRHWFLSCNKFTCYIQTDEENKVVGVVDANERSKVVRELIADFAGKPAKKLIKHIQRKFGGLHVTEFDEHGKAF